MKTLFIIFALAISLPLAGCYSSSTKEPGSDSADQTAPASPGSYRY